jgi:hypothetical protein
MPANREEGLNVDVLNAAIEVYQRRGNIREAAIALGIPWQRMWVILSMRGLLAGQAQNQTAATAQPRAHRRARRELTFGIEIECVLPAGTVECGGYHTGRAIPGLPTGWNAQHDASINANSTPAAPKQGAEIVSPILTGADGIRQVIEVCRWLESVGAKVNQSCGFHVHIGWAGTGAQLTKLVRLVSKNERGIFAATGTKQREQSHYCRPICSDNRYRALANGMRVRMTERYFSLNLTNLRRGGKKTVEFRAFAGTTSVVKVLAYVQLCLGLVEKAMAVSTEVEMDCPPNSGVKAARLLLAELGWGNCTNYGLINEPTAPTAIDLAFEIGRLAQKYDGNGEPETN